MLKYVEMYMYLLRHENLHSSLVRCWSVVCGIVLVIISWWYTKEGM